MGQVYHLLNLTEISGSALRVVIRRQGTIVWLKMPDDCRSLSRLKSEFGRGRES
jgi:hypothetical protein